MSDKDGGQAFPRNTMETIDGENTGRFDGMTLRDYFAAQAMTRYLSQSYINSMDVLAQQAYAMADAMLEERTKKP